MASEHALELHLEVDDADAVEIARLTRRLRGQLEALDVDAVQPISRGPAPEGSKALDWIVLGGLLVQLGPAAIAAVVHTLQA